MAGQVQQLGESFSTKTISSAFTGPVIIKRRFQVSPFIVANINVTGLWVIRNANGVASVVKTPVRSAETSSQLTAGQGWHKDRARKASGSVREVIGSRNDCRSIHTLSFSSGSFRDEIIKPECLYLHNCDSNGYCFTDLASVEGISTMGFSGFSGIFQAATTLAVKF